MSNKLIPELRFPEFKNEGEWTEKKISELGETINGLTGKNGEDFGIGKSYVTYKQVFDNSIIDFHKCGKVKIDENENQNTLKKGDILFTTSSETPNEVGFASVLVDSPKEDIYLNSFCFALRPFELEKTQPQFSRYLFHSPVYRKSVTAIAQGSTRYNLSKGAFLNLKVLFPNNQEQQKIASCLSSLDEVIAVHTQKLELLKDHKKGLMQNLFPQKGEKVPKCRFKEFEKDGEWVEKKLADISSKIMVGIASAATQAYRKSGIILFRNQNIKEGYLDDTDILFLDEDYEKEHKNKRLKAGDLLTARTGYPGITCVVPEKYEGSQSFTTLITRPIPDFIISKFLCYYINSETGQEFFNATKIGGGQQNVNAGSLAEMPILFPFKKEQQKIASCLSSLDELITAQAEKIEQLKLHKKGLMQGLFPKMK